MTGCELGKPLRCRSQQVISSRQSSIDAPLVIDSHTLAPRSLAAQSKRLKECIFFGSGIQAAPDHSEA